MREKKANRKLLPKRKLTEQFTKDDVLKFVEGGFKRLKRLVEAEGRAIPNIDVIPGRNIRA